MVNKSNRAPVAGFVVQEHVSSYRVEEMGAPRYMGIVHLTVKNDLGYPIAVCLDHQRCVHQVPVGSWSPPILCGAGDMITFRNATLGINTVVVAEDEIDPMKQGKHSIIVTPELQQKWARAAMGVDVDDDPDRTHSDFEIPFSIIIQNNLPYSITVCWQGFHCGYDNIEPNSNMAQHSFVGHVFAIKNGKKYKGEDITSVDPIEIVKVHLGKNIITITEGSIRKWALTQDRTRQSLIDIKKDYIKASGTEWINSIRGPARSVHLSTGTQILTLTLS